MKNLFLSFLFLISLGCSQSDSNLTNESDNNNIDSELTGVFNLFPLAINPEFTTVKQVTLNDNTLVGIVKLGQEIRAYPYPFIVHNEIINDEFQGQKYAFSYCPITKSSLAFTRNEIFRASGLLFKDNLVPWDDKTETIWSQMLIKGLKGVNENKRFNTIPVIETTWKTITKHFPNAKVVSSNLFSTKDEPPNNDNNTNTDDQPNSNELVYGILNDFNNIRIFKYTDFNKTSLRRVTIQSNKFLVYGNPSLHIINAFKVDSFQDYIPIENEFPYIFRHTNGTKFDIFGRGTNGTILEKPKYAYVSIWSAWQDFYTNFTFQTTN